MVKASDPILSVIIPFYKKLNELRRVLPYNARQLGRPDVELVLVLDEPSQEAGVLRFLSQFPFLQVRVIVNDQPHAWRTPCAAINVGLRAALGRFVLVVSPETAFVSDVVNRVIQVLAERPKDVLLGRIAWATFAEARGTRVDHLYSAAIEAAGGFGFAEDYYGSIAAARNLFLAVNGYDESLSDWGVDDDNIRARLSMNGALLMLDRHLRLLHLADGTHQRNRSPARNDPARKRAIVNPKDAKANDEQWGMQFGRVALDWTAPPPTASGSASAVAVREPRLASGLTGRNGAQRPEVVAVFSYRYDAHLVPDLIENLRPIVDGWVSYDDRDSDELVSSELPRRRLLVQKAREMGARWVFAIDPDERAEAAMATRIDAMTASNDPVCWTFNLRELFAPDRYRVDGIWGTKAEPRLFPLRGDLMLRSGRVHRRWTSFAPRASDLNIYHLKMIDPERRRARRALYVHLDPESKLQKLGYDYLTDEAGAEFETIPHGREYAPFHRDDGGLWMADVTSNEPPEPQVAARR
jgi:hypothetical protein